MSTLSLAFGDGLIYTYDGTGAEDGLKKYPFPVIPVNDSIDYGVIYNLAQTFVTTAIGSATKLIVSNSDGFGSTTDEHDKLQEPIDPGAFKGFCLVSDTTLIKLIKLLIQKKVNTIKGVMIPKGGKYMKLYCYKCNTLNTAVNGINGSTEVVEGSICKHRMEPAAFSAYAMWHSLTPP
jgi:hypothetical protein